MKNRTLFLSTVLLAAFGCEEPEATQEQREMPAEGERPMTERAPAETLPKEPAPAAAPVTPEEKPRAEIPEVKIPVPQPIEQREPSTAQPGTKSTLSYLPEGCKAVTHAKMAELMELPGVREHLVPAITEARAGDTDFKQFFSLLKDAGIDSSKDVESVALCVVEAPTANELAEGVNLAAKTSVVLAAKANVEKGDLVDALQSRAGADAEIIDVEGSRVFSDKKRNLVVGQTQDGIIVAAANRETFVRALAGGANYDIPSDKAFSLLLPQASMKSTIERFGDPTAKQLAANLERTVFVFDASKKELSLRLDMPDHTQAAEIGGVFKAQLASWQGTAPRDPMEKRMSDLLRDAKVQYEDDVAVVALPVSDDQIEATMKNLADQVRAMSETEKPRVTS